MKRLQITWNYGADRSRSMFHSIWWSGYDRRTRLHWAWKSSINMKAISMLFFIPRWWWWFNRRCICLHQISSSRNFKIIGVEPVDALVLKVALGETVSRSLAQVGIFAKGCRSEIGKHTFCESLKDTVVKYYRLLPMKLRGDKKTPNDDTRANYWTTARRMCLSGLKKIHWAEKTRKAKLGLHPIEWVRNVKLSSPFAMYLSGRLGEKHEAINCRKNSRTLGVFKDFCQALVWVETLPNLNYPLCDDQQGESVCVCLMVAGTGTAEKSYVKI